jgi:hypothetical protein
MVMVQSFEVDLLFIYLSMAYLTGILKTQTTHYTASIWDNTQQI